MTAARITMRTTKPAIIRERLDLRQPRELTCFSVSVVDMLVDMGRKGWNQKKKGGNQVEKEM
jgi:hypothetical protein